jgi:hypothetical protein
MTSSEDFLVMAWFLIASVANVAELKLNREYELTWVPRFAIADAFLPLWGWS